MFLRTFDIPPFTVSKVWGFLLFLLFLAWRHHSHGERAVWTAPVTSFPWFHSGGYSEKGKLPPPVTTPVDRSRTKDAGALSLPKGQEELMKPRAKPQDLQKIKTNHLTPPPKRGERDSRKRDHDQWLPKSADAPAAPPPPPKASVSRSNTRGRRSSRDRHPDARGRSHERPRDRDPHRRRSSSRRGDQLSRDNSKRKRPSAGHHPGTARDPYRRDASPRR